MRVFSAVSSVVLFSSAVGMAAPVTLLQADFGTSTAAATQQSGFTAYINPTTAVTFSNGDTGTASLVFSNTDSSRSRDRGAFTSPVTNLYEDFYQASSGQILGANLTGLLPSQDYTFQIWCYDEQNGTQTVVASDVTTGHTATQVASIQNGDGSPGSFPQAITQYTATFTITSNSSGQISLNFDGQQTGGSLGPIGKLNGLLITADVPEPASLSLLAAPAGLLLGRKRRTRR